MRKRQWTVLLASVLGIWIAGQLSPVRSEGAAVAVTRVSLDEARRQVRMMNDIYLAGVMTTHRMYVQEPGVPSAVAWGKQVIRQVTSHGWPEARIFSTTDRPLNPENELAGAFEQAAVSAFKRGEASLERVEGETLRFAVPIKISEKSCLSCHVRDKIGDLIGGVAYRGFLQSGAARSR